MQTIQHGNRNETIDTSKYVNNSAMDQPRKQGLPLNTITNDSLNADYVKATTQKIANATNGF